MNYSKNPLLEVYIVLFIEKDNTPNVVLLPSKTATSMTLRLSGEAIVPSQLNFPNQEPTRQGIYHFLKKDFGEPLGPEIFKSVDFSIYWKGKFAGSYQNKSVEIARYVFAAQHDDWNTFSRCLEDSEKLWDIFPYTVDELSNAKGRVPGWVKQAANHLFEETYPI